MLRRVAEEDRFFLLLEREPPPSSCVWAFCFEDVVLDGDRFQAAVARAVEQHPKAGCRIVRRRSIFGAEPWWEQAPDPSARACVFHSAIGAETESAVLAMAERLVNTAFALSRGPLFSFHWLPMPGRRGALFFHFHHALADARSSLLFLHDAVRAYNGETHQGRGSEGHQVSASSRSGSFVTSPPRQLSSARQLFILAAYGIREAGRCGFRFPKSIFPLGRVADGTIAAICRSVPAQRIETPVLTRPSVGQTARLVAASAIAIDRWCRERGLPTGALRIGITSDLRPNEPVQELGTSVSALPIWIGPSDLEKPQQLTDHVQQRIERCRRHRVPEAMMLIARPLGLPECFIGPLFDRVRQSRGLDTLVVSNVGALRVHGVPATTWLAPGAARLRSAYVLSRPVEGVGAVLNVLRVADQVQLCLCYLPGMLEADEASRLLELTEQALREPAGARYPAMTVEAAL